jgi:hypothetical protein
MPLYFALPKHATVRVMEKSFYAAEFFLGQVRAPENPLSVLQCTQLDVEHRIFAEYHSKPFFGEAIFLYLKTTAETCIEHVRERARPFENVDLDVLSRIRKQHEELLVQNPCCILYMMYPVGC